METGWLGLDKESSQSCNSESDNVDVREVRGERRVSMSSNLTREYGVFQAVLGREEISSDTNKVTDSHLGACNWCLTVTEENEIWAVWFILVLEYRTCIPFRAEIITKNHLITKYYFNLSDCEMGSVGRPGLSSSRPHHLTSIHYTLSEIAKY